MKTINDSNSRTLFSEFVYQMADNNLDINRKEQTRQLPGLKVACSLRSGGELPKNDNPKPYYPARPVS